MKRFYTTILALIASAGFLCSQNLSGRLEEFQSGALREFTGYFTSAALTPANQLKLEATVEYMDCSWAVKKVIIGNVMDSWKESLIIVQAGTRKELWGWNRITAEADVIEKWDLNGYSLSGSSDTPASNIATHPWFFYIGNMVVMDSEKNLNAALNFRIGFFLLRDKWDFALSLSEQVSGNIESETDMTIETSAGLMSKFYFPLKSLGLSPYAGGMASLSLSDGSVSVTPAFLGGISWFQGIGCLDLGISAGKSTMLMVGFTVIPNYKYRSK